MEPTHGLLAWQDGPLSVVRPVSTEEPMLTKKEDDADIHLWAVRDSDTVYAKEHCDFGAKLPLKVIKHTNLTGGLPAFCSGELLFLGENTVYINGRSRRYGPRNPQELHDIALAFKQSGYEVASMGMDADTNWAYPFFGKRALWI